MAKKRNAGVTYGKRKADGSRDKITRTENYIQVHAASDRLWGAVGAGRSIHLAEEEVVGRHAVNDNFTAPARPSGRAGLSTKQTRRKVTYPD